MTSTEVVHAASAGPPSVGKEPKSHRKPRRRRRMLTGVSRQRRAANARERQRIQGVNDAFLSLRAILPVLKPEDVSKMETLRLAAKWIAHLTALLIQDDRKRKWSPENSSGKCLPPKVQEKLDELLSFDLEDFILVEHADSRSVENTAKQDSKIESIKCLEENQKGHQKHSEDGSPTGSDCLDSDIADSSSDGSDPLQSDGDSGVSSPGIPHPGGATEHRGGLYRDPALPPDLLLDFTNLSSLGHSSPYHGFNTGLRNYHLGLSSCHTGL